MYPEEDFSTVTVNKSIDDLAEFAVKNGITYKSLRHANPWLRDSFLKVPSGKSYTLKMSREVLERLFCTQIPERTLKSPALRYE
ncbi:MAG TPA: hypothetical protein VHP30_08635, partial [Ignavibacteriales bacterium]|nr:hypothetical protein [Ignavibacteriales bacterium]